MKERNEQYRVIVKVKNNGYKNEDKFLKYHVRNLLKFTSFLDEKHADWKWFNVFDKKGNQIANYTINSRPSTPRVY